MFICKMLTEQVDVNWALSGPCPKFPSLDVLNRRNPGAACIQLMWNQESQQKRAGKLWACFYSQTQAAHLWHYEASNLYVSLQEHASIGHTGYFSAVWSRDNSIIIATWKTPLLITEQLLSSHTAHSCFSPTNTGRKISHKGYTTLFQDIQKTTVTKPKQQQQKQSSRSSSDTSPKWCLSLNHHLAY